MADGDVWEIAIKGTLLSQQYVNVWHAQLTGAGSTVQDAIDDIMTTFYSPLLTSDLTNQMSLTVASCRLYADPVELYDAALAATGAQGGEPLPPQCAGVFTLKTGLAGRSRRGRLYLGGHLELYQASGQWTGAYVTALQARANAMVALAGIGGTSPDWRWGVWSKKLGEPSPGLYNTGAGFRTIKEVVFRPVVYTQRRRTIGVGA